jgi:hypothetical protein
MSRARLWIAMSSLVVSSAVLLLGCREAGVTAVVLDFGDGGGATSRPDAGGKAPGTGRDGSADPDDPGACPAGYQCLDLKATYGLVGMDQEGEEFTASCTKGMTVTECDDDDPAGSCSMFTHAICGHVAGMVSCGQRCTP